MRIVLPGVTLILMVVIWQLVSVIWRIPQYILPRPGSVAISVGDNWSLLLRQARVTLEETLLGFVLALAVGVLLSVVMMLWQPVQDALYPLVVLTQVIPKVAIAPLVVIYLGFGQSPKVFLAFVIAFFPVVINTTLGLKSVAPELIELMASLGASRWQIMVKVRLRRALPYVIEGSKVTITLAVIGAVVGEFNSGSEGLGYLIQYASSNIDTALAYAALFVLVVMGIVLFEVLDIFGRKATHHRGRQAEVTSGSKWTS